MKAGRVSRRFTVRNDGGSAVTVTKLYTSCMCTTVRLSVGNRTVGPFGMPGHGAIPRLDETIDPGGEAIVEMTFNPAAHGPAGVGRVTRAITLENDNGAPLQLTFTALVAP